MDKKVLSILGAVLLLVVVAAGVYLYLGQLDTDSEQDSRAQDTSENSNQDTGGEVSDEGVVDSTSYESEKGVAVTVETPTRGGEVASPLEVTGSVPGSWSHEGEFTLRLLDSNSDVISEAQATLDGDWMTEDAVRFSGTLTYEEQPTGTGLLVLVRANPSDLAENADSVTIPIAF